MLAAMFRKKMPAKAVKFRQKDTMVWLDCPETLPCRLKVYDLAFRCVLDRTVRTNSPFDLSRLSGGLYTVKVISAEGYRLTKYTVAFRLRCRNWRRSIFVWQRCCFPQFGRYCTTLVSEFKRIKRSWPFKKKRLTR